MVAIGLPSTVSGATASITLRPSFSLSAWVASLVSSGAWCIVLEVCNLADLAAVGAGDPDDLAILSRVDRYFVNIRVEFVELFDFALKVFVADLLGGVGVGAEELGYQGGELFEVFVNCRGESVNGDVDDPADDRDAPSCQPQQDFRAQAELLLKGNLAGIFRVCFHGRMRQSFGFDGK